MAATKSSEPRKPKKKRTPKVPEQINFPQRYRVVAADFSLSRPGFSTFVVEQKDGQVTISNLTTTCIDNKRSKKKTHGQILDEIMSGMDALISSCEDEESLPTFFVREKAFNSRAAMSEIGIFKVVGIADWLMWKRLQSEWHEIYPVSVKKCITNSGTADKAAVADHLRYYVGDHTYPTDDESDATAVGIGWLIQQGQLHTIQITK